MWNGQAYAVNSSSQFSRAVRALEAIELSAGSNVLDIGCGSGNVTQYIAQRFPEAKIIGFDSSPSMVRQAQQTCSNCANVGILLQDARDFHFDGQQFDLIFSSFCLQWLSESEQASVFKNIYKHLKPGGKLCVLLPCYDFPHEVIKGVAFSDKWSPYFLGYQEQQAFLKPNFYHECLASAGFDDLRVAEMESSHLMTDQEFIDFTSQWCGCYQCLKESSLQQAFLADIRLALAKEPHEESGKFVMRQRSLHLLGGNPDSCVNKVGFGVRL